MTLFYERRGRLRTRCGTGSPADKIAIRPNLDRLVTIVWHHQRSWLFRHKSRQFHKPNAVRYFADESDLLKTVP